MRILFIALPAVLAGLGQASEFHSGQAARAVIGQSSFSSHDSGVTASALSLTHGRLYAAEAERLLAFDVSNPCAICGFAPVAITRQSVMRGVAAIAVSGKVVVMADPARHRVVIWRDTTPGPGVIGAVEPDVSLSSAADPVSVAYDGRRLFVGDGVEHRVLIWNGLPASDTQPPDAILGEGDNSIGAATVGTPSALVSDGANLYVADTENRRILVFSAGDTELAENDIVNSATLAPSALAPGTLVTIKANGLAGGAESAEQSESAALPTELAGVQVFLNGSPLPLLSVTPASIQAQLPFDLGNGTSGSLYWRSSALVSGAAVVRFAAASPGIFAIGQVEPRSGLLLHAAEQAAGDEAAKGAPVTTDDPAVPGERIAIWASGLGFEGDGPTLPVRATVNGEAVEVVSVRLPKGSAGVYEVVVVLPARIVAGREAVLQLVENAIASNRVAFPIRASAARIN